MEKPRQLTIGLSLFGLRKPTGPASNGRVGFVLLPLVDTCGEFESLLFGKTMDSKSSFSAIKNFKHTSAGRPTMHCGTQSVSEILQKYLPGLVDDFYEEIERHPDAMKVITGGQPQINRLKGTLVKWLQELLAGPYNSDYVARRWKVGWRHVEIGLDQVYTNVALSRLRKGLLTALDECWSGTTTRTSRHSQVTQFADGSRSRHHRGRVSSGVPRPPAAFGTARRDRPGRRRHRTRTAQSAQRDQDVRYITCSMPAIRRPRSKPSICNASNAMLRWRTASLPRCRISRRCRCPTCSRSP